MIETMVQAIIEMDEGKALAIARELLDSGTDPTAVLDHCRGAVEKVGTLFEQGTYFIPELLLAGEMVTQIAEIAKSKMKHSGAADRPRLGKVVIGTVQGDIHDIGKGIVSFMLNLHGFEVVDLGVDVPPERFVKAVADHTPQVLGLCGLLTLAYDPMKKTVAALGEAGLRDRVKIMVGGGAIDDEVSRYVCADAYGKDAVAAVRLARIWVGGRE
jgi:5-methyltetrahydrofolate--homocysteine methyltransferase